MNARSARSNLNESRSSSAVGAADEDRQRPLAEARVGDPQPVEGRRVVYRDQGLGATVTLEPPRERPHQGPGQARVEPLVGVVDGEQRWRVRVEPQHGREEHVECALAGVVGGQLAAPVRHVPVTEADGSSRDGHGAGHGREVARADLDVPDPPKQLRELFQQQLSLDAGGLEELLHRLGEPSSRQPDGRRACGSGTRPRIVWVEGVKMA